MLRAMEEAGQCRRGYFVEGLGAAQFALPGAVDRMRAIAAAQEAAAERRSRATWLRPQIFSAAWITASSPHARVNNASAARTSPGGNLGATGEPVTVSFSALKLAANPAERELLARRLTL